MLMKKRRNARTLEQKKRGVLREISPGHRGFKSHPRG